MTTNRAVRSGLFPLFGRWVLDTNEPVVSLNLGDGEDGGEYWIPLDRFGSAEDVLFWILHVAAKESFRGAVGDLARSVSWLFGEQCDLGDDAERMACRRVVGTPLPDEEALHPVGETTAGGIPWQTLAQWVENDASALRERTALKRYELGERGAKLLRGDP